MTSREKPDPEPERLAVATMDHHLALLGYSAVPDPRPAGGWRRLYMKDGAADPLSVVGSSTGGWCSVGVEIAIRRSLASTRAEDLLRALSAYEVAVDLDAAAGRPRPEVIVRVALRVFIEGLCAAVVRDVVDNVAEAAAVTRRVLAGAS